MQRTVAECRYAA